ncbi:methyltransferase domain-containing protein [Podospora didyma]|uniref:Methyltransferase domain-containing protein n=1 Tax=Podospora didyma TaxID=330526 RepID=A0AAE0KKB1_9PEZI|nr:methyltransferase domain-containing protein [Podospora didyma]
MADPAAVSPPAAPGTASPSAPATAAAAASASPENDAPIEIDDTFNDGDSALGSQITAFTESLSSSVIDYPFKHGRRYHKFRSGAYPFPNDDIEADRLDLAHHLMFLATGRRNYLAPIEEKQLHRILDIGTGTGIWAITVGDEFPNAEVIGNDLSAIQPTWVPPNVRFEVDDVESPWVYSHKFDFIFCRYMACTILDWNKLVQNAFDNLNPGGWAEFQDWNLTIYSEDGSLASDRPIQKWMGLLLEATKITNREMNPGPRLEGWVKDAGFTNIVHERFKCPMGAWPKDPTYKEIGLYNLVQCEEGVEAFSLHLLMGVLKWKREEVEVLLADVRKDFRDPSLHMQYDFHVVYGQKPSD